MQFWTWSVTPVDRDQDGLAETARFDTHIYASFVGGPYNATLHANIESTSGAVLYTVSSGWFEAEYPTGFDWTAFVAIGKADPSQNYTAALEMEQGGPYCQRVSTSVFLNTAATYHPTLASTPSSRIAAENTTVTYNLNLTNMGSASDRFRLEVSSLLGWNANYPTNTLFVARAASMSVIVQVDVPANAPAGSAETTVVTARSLIDASALATVSLETTVEPQVFAVGLNSSMLFVSAHMGTQSTVSLVAQNLGNNLDRLTFSVDAPPPAWAAEVSLSAAALPAGGTAAFTVTISAPVAFDGTHEFRLPVTARSSDGATVAAVYFTVTFAHADLAVSASSVALSSAQPLVATELGVTVTVRNAGSIDAPGVTVHLLDGLVNLTLAAFVPAGGATPFTFTYIPDKGAHRAHVYVDPFGLFEEFDETNNEAEFAFNVSSPDMALGPGDLVLPPDIAPGEEVQFLLRVHNIGPYDATDVPVVIRLNGDIFLSTTVPFVEGGGGTRDLYIAWKGAPGNWTFRAEVFASPGAFDLDTANNVVTAETTVTVPNVPPAAELRLISAAVAGNVSRLSANFSSDLDGKVVAYSVDFGDGNFSGWVPDRLINHTYASAGTYTLTLQVMDDDGAVSAFWVGDITVKPAAAPPPTQQQQQQQPLEEGTIPGPGALAAAIGLAAAALVAARRRRN